MVNALVNFKILAINFILNIIVKETIINIKVMYVIGKMENV